MIGLIFGETSFPLEILKKIKQTKKYIIIDLTISFFISIEGKSGTKKECLKKNSKNLRNCVLVKFQKRNKILELIFYYWIKND